jgi:hypothetical protein
MHTRIKDELKSVTQRDLDGLSFYEYNIDGEAFKENFVKAGGTPDMANHLWNKFVSHNHSILPVFGYADLKNKKLLTKTVKMGYR